MAEVYARISGGVVRDVITRAMGSPPISMMFHPSILAELRRLTDEEAAVVVPGWLLVDGVLQAPPPPEAEPPSILYVPAALARERLEADGFWDEFSAILTAEPAAMLKVLTLREGIDPSDAQAVALIGASGADPDRILAPPGTVLPPLEPPP